MIDELYDKLHERISKLEDELDALHIEELATENALSTWDYIDTRLSECSSDRVRVRFLGMLDGGEEDSGYFVSEYGLKLSALREQIKLKQAEFEAIEAQIEQLRGEK